MNVAGRPDITFLNQKLAKRICTEQSKADCFIIYVQNAAKSTGIVWHSLQGNFANFAK